MYSEWLYFELLRRPKGTRYESTNNSKYREPKYISGTTTGNVVGRPTDFESTKERFQVNCKGGVISEGILNLVPSKKEMYEITFHFFNFNFNFGKILILLHKSRWYKSQT